MGQAHLRTNCASTLELEHLDGPRAGQFYQCFVTGTLIVSDGGGDIALIKESPLAVSDAYARLFLDNKGRWHLLNLSSPNGMFVNGGKTQEILLGDGDEISFGSTGASLWVSIEETAPEPDPRKAQFSGAEQTAPPAAPVTGCEGWWTTPGLVIALMVGGLLLAPLMSQLLTALEGMFTTTAHEVRAVPNAFGDVASSTERVQTPSEEGLIAWSWAGYYARERERARKNAEEQAEAEQRKRDDDAFYEKRRQQKRDDEAFYARQRQQKRDDEAFYERQRQKKRDDDAFYERQRQANRWR